MKVIERNFIEKNTRKKTREIIVNQTKEILITHNRKKNK